MNKFIKKILKSKGLYIFAAILMQLIILFLLMTYFSYEFLPVYYIMIILSIIVSIVVINRDTDPSSKILWVLLIMGVPFCGGLLYLFFGGKKIPKALMIQDRQAYSDYRRYAIQNMKALEHADDRDMILNKMVSMSWNNGYLPVYDNSATRYFKTGQEQFEAILEALEKAQEYIFIETYILDYGVMWEAILSILKRKAAQGVDVRVIYDDFGSILNIEPDYPEKLAAWGIKCHTFNPIKAQLAIQMNNRDHRKIIVVDGKTAFTGGINIADEYINRVERFGYWKDMGIEITGPAVELFTISFIQIWNYSAEKNTAYEPFVKHDFEFDHLEHDGYVLPFSDSPTDTCTIGKNLHLNMLATSYKYFWITTPYFILDHEIETALLLAVNNGVDVRIVVPGVPDKKLVYEVTRANYAHLIEKGVKIYEYTPGFIHGKVTISDDCQALVGTVNMDYRSYYYNYECGIWMYQTESLKTIKEDLQEIFEKSHLVTMEDVRKTPVHIRWRRAVLKVFAPLL